MRAFVYRHIGLRRVAGVLAYSAFAVALTACGTDGISAAGGSPIHLRVVNGVLYVHGGDTATTPIDFLIDSAAGEPSILGIPGASVSTCDSVNGYRTIPSGVHGFLARAAGDTRADNSLYTTPYATAFVPRQAMLSGTYYTMIVAGVVPDSGDRLGNDVMFSFTIEDPLPGPLIESTGVLQSRFRVVNAAPNAAPGSGSFGSVSVYLTPGSAIPADPRVYYATGRAVYRSASSYINVNPGSYVVSIISNGTGAILAQQPLTFARGEVRSLILLSTAAGVPGTANHKLISVLDHQY